VRQGYDGVRGGEQAPTFLPCSTASRLCIGMFDIVTFASSDILSTGTAELRPIQAQLSNLSRKTAPHDVHNPLYRVGAVFWFKKDYFRSKKSRSPPASPSRAVPYSRFFPALNDDLYPAAFLETLNNSPTLSSRDKYIIVKIAMGRRDRPQRTFKLPLDRHLVAVATSNSINLRQVTLFYGKPSPTPGLSCACRSPRSQPCPDVTDTNSVAVLHILLIEELHI
jgi:hypothetical protein